jgi:hypothetical protein
MSMRNPESADLLADFTKGTRLRSCEMYNALVVPLGWELVSVINSNSSAEVLNFRFMMAGNNQR